MAVLVLLAACSREAKVPSGLDGLDEISAAESLSGKTPCNLLASEEIELSLNAPVQSHQAGGRPVVATMAMCSMVSSSGRTSAEGEEGLLGSAASWGILTKDAGKSFREFRRVNAPHLDAYKVEGLEMLWDEGLRTLVVLSPDGVIFGIRLTAKQLPLGKAQTTSAYLRATAEDLAERALKRLKSQPDDV